MSVWMSVSLVKRSQLSSDFDETWHTYSLIYILDVESFFDRGENKGETGKGWKFALATVFSGF